MRNDDERESERRRGLTWNFAERGATAGIVALVTDAVLHNPADAEYEIAIDVAAALGKLRPGAGGQEFEGASDRISEACALAR